MLRAAVVAIAIGGSGGCFDPTYPVGLPCGPDCPPGQVCRFGVCSLPEDMIDAADVVPTPDASADATPAPDAQTFDGPPGDSDSDGVLDSVDNCAAIANSDQHDEDADTAGDVCDPCPHLPAGMPFADADGDGVGDACDPSATVAHHIAHFDPFVTLSPDWDVSSSWQVINDQLVFPLTGATYPYLMWSSGESTMTLGGEATFNPSGIRSLVISFGPQEPAPYYYCELYVQGTSGGIVGITHHQGGSYNTIAFVPAPGNLPSGKFQISAGESVSAATMSCRVGLMGLAPLQASSAVPGHTSDQRISLSFVGTSVRLDYAIQIVVD